MATSTASSGAFYEGTIEGENGNPIAVFADHIKDVRTSVLPSVTSNSVARDYVAAKLNEFSFLVVGPPRVGKSTLINAMLNGHVADTSGGMAACTSQVRCFDRTISYADAQPVTLHFTDSPGIEDWPRAQATVTQYLSAANPVCVFFCFAPARFAQISEFVPIIQKLVDAHVFVALVLTNMYTGGLTEIKDTWNQMVSLAAPLGAFQSSTRDGYGMEVIRRYEKGLCMQVNSIEYNGPRGVTYPANINTFITGGYQCPLGSFLI